MTRAMANFFSKLVNSMMNMRGEVEVYCICRGRALQQAFPMFTSFHMLPRCSNESPSLSILQSTCLDLTVLEVANVGPRKRLISQGKGLIGWRAPSLFNDMHLI